MKKITLLTLVGAAILVAGSLFAKDRRIWLGGVGVPVPTSRLWDLVNPNWTDPDSPLYFLANTYVPGATVTFDDSTDSTNVKVSGLMSVDSILINSTKNYVVDTLAGAKAGLTGPGILIKDGTGTFGMNVRNSLLGGTIIKNGRLKMTNSAAISPNIFGSSLTFNGGIANFASSSASTYPTVTVPVIIPAGVTAYVELSRYSYWASPITGSGDLVISVGGERSMLGTNKSGTKIDWSNFTGNLTLQRNKVTGVTPGYYGLLIPSTKTYDYTNLATVDSLLSNKKVLLKSGTGLTACSGTHCWMIGELTAENDSSFVAGYGAGDSGSPIVTWMIGSLNTDVVFPGTIKDAGTKSQDVVGIIKVGTGKYTFTSTKSITSVSRGIEVKAGTLIVDIPVTNTTTGLGRVKVGNVLTIRANATAGGNGRLTGPLQVDSLGTLVIGNNGIGQIVLGDTLTGTIKSPLNISHGGKVIFKIASKNSFDNITTNSSAIFNGSTILVKPASNLSLHDGDSLTILTTKTRTAVDSFTVTTQGFPVGTSITYAKDTIANSGYKITLIVHGSTAVANPLENSSISVYPNPTRGEVNISSSEAEIATVEIMNVQGQSILKRDVRSNKTNIKLDSFAAGIYYTKITTAKGTKVQKLLIQ
ncbi:MAG: T9SS type A sorting domain-containing protein [Paludibacter sp.]|nr:T9SS type A sorting domain-containing protein [Paludibacter sp.]